MLNWSLWLGLYLCFLWWHGASRRHFLLKRSIGNKLYELKPDQTLEAYKAQLANDKGTPIFMVNTIKYFDEPVKTEDQVEEIEAEQLVKTYNNYVGKFLISYPIFLGNGRYSSSLGGG
jgi:hypothetical protein